MLTWWSTTSPALSPGKGSGARLGHVPVPARLGERFPFGPSGPLGPGTPLSSLLSDPSCMLQSWHATEAFEEGLIPTIELHERV